MSGFYAACGREVSARTRADEGLLVQVRASFAQHRKRDGSLHVRRHLAANRHPCPQQVRRPPDARSRARGRAQEALRETILPLRALQPASATRQAPDGLLHHSDRESQGGFNRSWQHLLNEVDDDKDRQAKIEPFYPQQDGVAGSPARIGQDGAAALLGGDRAWTDERGCRAGGWRVRTRWHALVSPFWWYAAFTSPFVRARSIPALPVAARARRARALACRRAWRTRDRVHAWSIAVHYLA